jgi:hypothetical protein
MIERGRDGPEGIGAGQHVGDEDAVVVGPRAAVLVGQMGEVIARGGVDDGRVGGQSGRGPGLAIAGHGAEHEIGTHGPEGLVVEPEPLHHAGPEILHHEIGVGDQALDDVDGRGLLEIEHEAPLARIELPEVAAHPVAQRRPGAHQLAVRGLDLHHVGAEVGQQPGAMRTGDGGREVEDAHAVQDVVVHVRWIQAIIHSKGVEP